jgi:hypothetical protein
VLEATQVLCPNLAANAIITWNTVYMAEALDAIRDEGVAGDNDDLAHVPPTLWPHVNVYGKYEFDVDAGSRRAGDGCLAVAQFGRDRAQALATLAQQMDGTAFHAS